MLVASLPAAIAQPQSSTSSNYVKVVCDFDDPRVQDQAARIANESWAMAAVVLNVKSDPPAEPCTLYLYESIAAYEAADKRLTGGKFRQNLAFTTRSKPEAHIVLQPPMAADVRKRIGIPELTARLITHETTHLCRNTHFPNRADHPRWFVDGVAYSVEIGMYGGAGHLKDERISPLDQELVVALKRLSGADRLPSVDAIFNDRPGDLSNGDVYAANQLAFGYFAFRANDSGWLGRVVSEARRLAGGSDYKKSLHDAAMKALPESVEEADKEFRKWIADAKPLWRQLYRSLEFGRNDWKQIAFSGKNAIAWRIARLKTPLQISGSVEILAGEKKQMNVLLGRADDDFYSVALVAGYGVTVFHYTAQGNTWTQLATRELANVKVDSPVKFVVRAKSSRLVVKIGGEEVFDLELPQPLKTMQWGVGAQSGSAGIWTGVKAAAIKQKK